MAEHLVGLDRISAHMRDAVREYAAFLRELAGSNGKALTMYGAVTSDQFDVDRHTAHNVLVLDSIDLGMLRRLSEQGARLGKSRIRAPLIMTPKYIDESRDTFPLELIEIHQQHATVFGEDYFAELAFAEADIRLQCERELKSVAIQLRQGLLAAAGREQFLEQVETGMGEALLRTLRGMLWLKGTKDGEPAGAVIDEIERLSESRLNGIRTAVSPTAGHGWDGFTALCADVERLSEVVNGW